MIRALIALLIMPAFLAAGPLAPVQLRCEYLTNPLGIDRPDPRFGWVLQHTGHGVRQRAYQLIVSTRPDTAAPDFWDSGRVESPDFTHVVYKGRPLESNRTYYWRVRWWDQDDVASPFSSAARFDTAMMSTADWKAKWIRGRNQLRKEFTLASAPVRARAFVSGTGYYELRINGAKVGDHVLDPGYTAYQKRILYSVYDVTSVLRQGVNAVGMMLGEGWAPSRAGILQIEAELPGGARATLLSDGSWKTKQGALLSDSIYHGEVYDARAETTGWDLPGYDDRAWEPVSLNDPPTGVLSAQTMPPIRVVGELIPLKMWSPQPSVHVYDFGQNFSGWARLKVTGPAGTRVRMRHAELIYDDGTLNVENLREARATDVYILKGSGEQEVYEPRFTYHGFRYLELTGFPGTPSLDTVVGRVVNSDVKTTGGFTASKPLLNQLQRIIRWGTLSNLHSVPTDCNQRDERMGWMADAHLVAETAILNFDMAAIYSNFVRLMRDDQEKDGSVPDTVPRARFASGPADPAWGSAYPLFIDYMWKHYGDRRLLEEHFDGIKAWADFLNSRARDGILDFVKFGDWVPVEKTPGNLVSTVYLYWSADIVARTAEILGKTAEATQYRQLADSIKAAFHKKFYRPETGDYGNGSQSSNVLPLFTGMVPREVAGRVNGTLINNIVYKDNTHLTTGILGTKYLFPYLTSRGRSDLAYELATQTTYPSWGYMIENGATTLWELWQNKTGPSMNSHNHPMFGSVGAWMYEALAGINAAAPGYARVRIQPQVVRDLKFASGSIESVRGRIASSWHRTSDGLKLDVIIPHGSTAEIHFPKLNLRDITIKDNDRVVWANGSAVGGNGITGGKESSNWLILEAGSGSYSFTLAGN